MGSIIIILYIKQPTRVFNTAHVKVWSGDDFLQLSYNGRLPLLLKSKTDDVPIVSLTESLGNPSARFKNLFYLSSHVQANSKRHCFHENWNLWKEIMSCFQKLAVLVRFHKPTTWEASAIYFHILGMQQFQLKGISPLGSTQFMTELTHL